MTRADLLPTQNIGSLFTKRPPPTPSQQPQVPGRVQRDYAPVSGRSPCWCGTSAGSCSSSAAGGTCWARARCPGPELECRSSQGSAEGHTLSLTSPGGATSQRHTHTVLSRAESSGLQEQVPISAQTPTSLQQTMRPHHTNSLGGRNLSFKTWTSVCHLLQPHFQLPVSHPPFHLLCSSHTQLPPFPTWVLSTL